MIQQRVKRALENVKDKDLKGIYYALNGMTKPVQKQLIEGNYFMCVWSTI
jgi:hypothetical protein